MPIERPIFNVYELLKTTKSEMLLLDHLQLSFKDDLLAKELPLRCMFHVTCVIYSQMITMIKNMTMKTMKSK